MKKWVLLFLLSSVALSVTAFANEVQLEVHTPKKAVKAQEVFSVKVEITGNPGFSATSFVLTWNHEEFDCISAHVGSLLDGALAATNPSAPDGAVLAAASMNEIRDDGTLGVFTFRAKQNLANCRFDMEDVILTAPDGDPIAHTLLGVAVIKPPDKPEEGTVEHQSTEEETPERVPGQSEEDNSVLRPENPKEQESAQPAKPENGDSKPGGVPAPKENGRPGEGEIVFTDTDDSWAKEYIRQGVQMGLFNGYSDGTFRPDKQLTRAQFMMVLWNQAGRPESKCKAPFQDMSNQIEGFQKAVSWAYEQGYVHGTAPDTFSPSAPLTRQATMKILFGRNGGQNGLESMLFNIYDHAFKDSGVISDWAKPGMYWGVYNGIISATENKSLDPAGIITRAHMAEIMVRYVNNMDVSA